MKTSVVLAALISVMTTIAACSSDEERLSTEEFLKQGNAICAAGQAVIDEGSTEMFASGEEPTPEQMTTFSNDILEPAVQGQIDGLNELSPPADLEDDVDQMLSAAQTALDKINDDPVAAFTGEEDPFANVNAQAASIGLTACSDGE